MRTRVKVNTPSPFSNFALTVKIAIVRPLPLVEAVDVDLTNIGSSKLFKLPTFDIYAIILRPFSLSKLAKPSG